MSGYRRAGGDDEDEHDSDLDLDLNELDPQTTSIRRPQSRRQASSPRSSYDFGGRIPLRNLRFGGRRRPHDEDTDDLAALVDGEDDARKRELATSSGFGGDDAPLLANGHSRRISNPTFYSHPKHTRRGQIWNWLPFTSRSTPIALPSSTEAEDVSTSETNRSVEVGAKQSICGLQRQVHPVLLLA